MRLFSRDRRPNRMSGRPAPRWRPKLVTLEDRWAPATLQVTSPLDDGSAGTLRYAVVHAHNGDTIALKGDVLNSGITLTQGELVLTQQSLTIETKPATRTATINAGGLSRIFELESGADVTLRDLIMTEGAVVDSDGTHDDRGGAVLVQAGATLTINACTLSNNFTAYYGYGFAPITPAGGAIYNDGVLAVKDSTLSGNGSDPTGNWTGKAAPSTTTARRPLTAAHFQATKDFLAVPSTTPARRRLRDALFPPIRQISSAVPSVAKAAR